MSETKRYLVGYSESSIVPQSMGEMLNSFAAEEGITIKSKRSRTGKVVLEMTEEQALKLVKKRPDLVIEEDLELEMFLPMPGLAPRVPVDAELTLTVKVVAEKGKKPIKDVTVYCAGDGVTYKGVTDDTGIAKVKVYEAQLKRVIVSPRDTYWSKALPALEVKEDTQIDVALIKIPVSGDYDWGHLLLGVDKVSKRFTGRGIKVAVIDSGVVDHEDIKASGGYNTLDGQDPEAWNVDEKGHGTHCSGIIAAHQNKVGVIGVAPEAEVFSLKVFPGGRFSDLIEAIEWCVENYMDVISMSLGSSTPSTQIEQALAEANERGITCIAAAGNDGGPVAYPAAYGSVIAVSAIGKLDTFPEDSSHALKIGDHFSHDGKLFLASFSNFGPEIDVCAPGVAILSSVPTGYASWDGTSMACPLISGLSALILEAYPEIRTGDAWQPYYVREIIKGSATDIGMSSELQGAGLPNAKSALASAYQQREYDEEIQASYHQYMETMLDRAKKAVRDIEGALVQLEKM